MEKETTLVILTDNGVVMGIFSSWDNAKESTLDYLQRHYPCDTLTNDDWNIGIQSLERYGYITPDSPLWYIVCDIKLFAMAIDVLAD